MLTGSMASNYYGTPRLTHDIDIVLQIKENQVSILFKMFSADHYLSAEAMRQAISDKSTFNLLDPASGMKIDFWLVKDDTYHQQAFARKRKVSFLGQEMMICSPEDLIIAKTLWAKRSGGSSKQMADIEGIKAMQGDSLDQEYLGSWLKELLED
jgi:hypothetical protein